MASNNKQVSREGTDLLAYESIYQHTIPRKIEEFGRASLPSLRIKGRAPQIEAFSSEWSKVELNAHLPLPKFKIEGKISPQAH